MKPANGQPATKQDLADLKAELELRFDSLQEMMRDMQTEMLKAFLPYQEAQNIRLHHVEVDAANHNSALKQRMEVLEGRLAEIEKRLFLHPPTP